MIDGPPPLPPGAEPAPGYAVIAHLARGKTLDVYDAWSAGRASRCIVKTLRPDRADDRAAARRLVAEGRLIRRLTHPHIVRGYEVVAGPPPVVVMETLAGATLAALIEDADPRRLPVRDVAHLGLHLASALGYLHSQGWLHLDLKPGNVVAEAGRAKLIDMSVARRPGRCPAGVGTWCYMAPEQARGGVVGPEADVWGIGVTLYEALTGQAAFDPDPPEGGTETTWETTTSGGPPRRRYPQLEGPPAPVRRLRRVPAALADLLAACLAPDPRDRPAIGPLMGALEPLAGLPPSERRFAAPAPPPA
ncbi:MAG: serine/threonine-protein kinase [Thermoleophilia bacterium]